jgi:hypothetical protein
VGDRINIVPTPDIHTRISQRYELFDQAAINDEQLSLPSCNLVHSSPRQEMDATRHFDGLWLPENLVGKQKSKSWAECNVIKEWPSTVPSPNVKSSFHRVRMRASAAKYQRYELGDPDEWFKELCTEAEARSSMLARLKEGQDVHMLTGLPHYAGRCGGCSKLLDAYAEKSRFDTGAYTNIRERDIPQLR